MSQNNNFNRTLEQSGLSMYALAKRSAVPYTTVNEIHNGKIDINQCAASTVFRLAAALGVESEAIINPIYYLDGVKGKYKGIDFTWSTSDVSRITFEYEGEPVTLCAGTIYNIPERLEYYSVFAGWMIEDYIEDRKWQQHAQEVIGRIAL